MHVPSSGVLDEDAERLLVHPPTPRGASRVWRCWPGRGDAEVLILRTIEEARAGGARLVWHTGDGVSPLFIDELLRQYGFERTEDLEVLAFELGTDPEPELPELRVPAGVGPRPIRDQADLSRANAVEGDVFLTTTWDERDTRAYLQGPSKPEGRRVRKPPDPDDAPIVLRYLAFVQENGGEEREVVATAGAEVTGRTVRLWGAGTLAGHRGRGAYRVLVMKRCRHAHTLGATLALAKANTTSLAPILRHAGFHLIARERRYALEMASPAHPRA